MCGALTRAAERWRSIRISAFERHQMAALRQELDHDHEAVVGLDTGSLRGFPQPTIRRPVSAWQARGLRRPRRALETRPEHG